MYGGRAQAAGTPAQVLPHATLDKPREEGSTLGSRVARRPRTSLSSATHGIQGDCQRTSLNASPLNRTLALEYMKTGRARFGI